LSIADQPLLTSVQGREDLLEAYDVEVVELFNKFIEPGILEICSVCLHRRWSHKHILSEKTDVLARDQILIEQVILFGSNLRRRLIPNWHVQGMILEGQLFEDVGIHKCITLIFY